MNLKTYNSKIILFTIIIITTFLGRKSPTLWYKKYGKIYFPYQLTAIQNLSARQKTNKNDT